MEIKKIIKKSPFLYEVIRSYLVRFDYGYLYTKTEVKHFLRSLKKNRAICQYDPAKPDVYIIIGDKNLDSTLKKAIFGDIAQGICQENSVFFTTRVLKNSKLKKLHRLYFKINKIIPLPFKYLWERTYTTADLSAMPEYNMFVIFMAGAYYEETFSQPELFRKIHMFAEKTYCKKILYLVDPIDKYPNLPDWFPYFDHIASYSRDDEAKYNTFFIDSPCVHLPVSRTAPEYDIYFRGMDAGRLPMIRDCYRYLKKNGVNCCFHVQTGPKDFTASQGFVCSGERIPYEVMVSEELKANVLLEILIPGVGSGPTLRGKEAVIYGKKLLTNNPRANESEFYSSGNIRIFQSVDDIDIDWIKETGSVKYDYVGQYSCDEVFRQIKNMCLKE